MEKAYQKEKHQKNIFWKKPIKKKNIKKRIFGKSLIKKNKTFEKVDQKKTKKFVEALDN